MSRWILTTTLLAIAAPAFADPDPATVPETVEDELRALALPDTGEHGFHAHAFAQLVGGSAGDASLGAGGELRYTADRCDAIRLGGDARLGWRAGAHASMEQWGSACVPFLVMEFGHHLEWDVRPALLAPLQLRAGTNRRETVSFHWQVLRAPLPKFLGALDRGEAKKEGLPEPVPMTPAQEAALPQGDIVIFDIHVDNTILFGPMQSTASRQRAEATPFGYVRHQVAPWGEARDYAIDIFSGGGEFVDQGATINVWLARLSNLVIGPVYASGGIGIASGDAGKFVMDGSMYPKREVELTTPRVLVGFETGGARLRGHLRATRDVEIVPDGYLTLDSRLATGLDLGVAGSRVGLEGAIALTDVRVPEARAAKGVTGGGALSIAHHLASNLDATLQLDVARSYYAANVTALDFVPRWGVTAFAALQATVGR